MSVRVMRNVAAAASLLLCLGAVSCTSSTNCYEGAMCGNKNTGNNVGGGADTKSPKATASPSRTSSAVPEPSPTKAAPIRATPPPAAPATTQPEVERCSDCEWRDWPGIQGVEVRPAWERKGDRFFLVAQWRSDVERRLDVWIWLKDAKGHEAVYPVDPPALAFHNMTTDRTGFRRPVEVGIELQPGRRYTICMYVLPYKPQQTGPNITNTAVDGVMNGFLYG